jgi:hypothetical protein
MARGVPAARDDDHGHGVAAGSARRDHPCHARGPGRGDSERGVPRPRGLPSAGRSRRRRLRADRAARSGGRGPADRCDRLADRRRASLRSRGIRGRRPAEDGGHSSGRGDGGRRRSADPRRLGGRESRRNLPEISRRVPARGARPAAIRAARARQLPVGAPRERPPAGRRAAAPRRACDPARLPARDRRRAGTRAGGCALSASQSGQRGARRRRAGRGRGRRPCSWRG